MAKMLTLAETTKMSEHKLQMEIGKCAKQLKELGMSHEEACNLVSTIMNLGYALQEKWYQTAKKTLILKRLSPNKDSFFFYKTFAKFTRYIMREINIKRRLIFMKKIIANILTLIMIVIVANGCSINEAYKETTKTDQILEWAEKTEAEAEELQNELMDLYVDVELEEVVRFMYEEYGDGLSYEEFCNEYFGEMFLESFIEG